MQKVEHVIVNYIESDKIETQGKRQEIQKYLDNGYYVKEDRNGYWVLVRTAKVQVTLTNSYGTKTFNRSSLWLIMTTLLFIGTKMC